MKILIEADSFSKSQFRDFIFSLDDHTEVVALVKSKAWLKLDFSDSRCRFRILDYSFFESFENINPYLPDMAQVVPIVMKVMDDHKTLLIGDRFGWFPKYGPGVFHYTRRLTAIVCNAFHFLVQEKFDCVFFRTTPHTSREWPVALTADLIGVPVLVCERGLVPWRCVLSNGLQKKRKICLPPQHPDSPTIVERERLETFFRNAQSTYAEAMPTYEFTRLKRNRNRHYDLNNDLVKYWRRPDLVFNKFRCYSTYKRLSVKFRPKDSSRKYIVFLLHYQPERTSLPEAYGFSQQLFAIQTLRIAVPRHVDILVKEHPSTFTNYCGLKERHKSFYEDLTHIDGVTLIDMEVNTFDLVDSALAVATLTGTVGREALLRGVPVIYFGRTLFDEVLGAHAFESVETLARFVNECIIGFSNEEIRRSVREKILSSLRYSVSGLTDEAIDDIYSVRIEDEAHLRILKMVISGVIDIHSPWDHSFDGIYKAST